MRPLRHLTPRYVADRALLAIHQRFHPDAPWLTCSLTEVFEQWLRPEDRGLEWGAGRSTLWLARRVSHLFTIEDNPSWEQRVRTKLEASGLADRVDLEVLPSTAEGGESAADVPYVRAVDRVPPKSLDFCIVDGAVRDHCALAALPLLRGGAILVIGNVERYLPRASRSRSPNARTVEDGYESEDWRAFANSVALWRCIWTTNGVWDTALWVKPCDGGQDMPDLAADRGINT